jgi:hypothetical protein
MDDSNQYILNIQMNPKELLFLRLMIFITPEIKLTVFYSAVSLHKTVLGRRLI